eukprot:9017257-Lingulodinium_polyedra.AAC.1
MGGGWEACFLPVGCRQYCQNINFNGQMCVAVRAAIRRDKGPFASVLEDIGVFKFGGSETH